MVAVSLKKKTRGHKVYTPTLTGLADRSHLMSGAINLDTHIADVVNLIKWEGLEDVCLLGHSSGGVVVSGAIEHVLAQVSSIVFLDAFMPENGEKGLDWNSPHARAAIEAAVKAGEVSRPPVKSALYNANEQDRAWLDAKATPQPIGTALQPMTLTGARDRVARKTYIRASTAIMPGPKPIPHGGPTRCPAAMWCRPTCRNGWWKSSKRWHNAPRNGASVRLAGRELWTDGMNPPGAVLSRHKHGF